MHCDCWNVKKFADAAGDVKGERKRNELRVGIEQRQCSNCISWVSVPLEQLREREDYNGSNSKRPKERKTVLCLLVKQVCQSKLWRTLTHIHTHSLSHRQLVSPLSLTVPMLESYFYLIGNPLVAECAVCTFKHDNDGALLCMKMRQTKRKKRLAHRRQSWSREEKSGSQVSLVSVAAVAVETIAVHCTTLLNERENVAKCALAAFPLAVALPEQSQLYVRGPNVCLQKNHHRWIHVQCTIIAAIIIIGSSSSRDVFSFFLFIACPTRGKTLSNWHTIVILVRK